MVECEVCKKTGEQVQLFNTIYENRIVKMCKVCADLEGVTIIAKPTQDQLMRADRRVSVKERMMRISGMENLHAVSKDHEIAQRYLSKIRIPVKAEEPEDLVENYNWIIKVARRRKKMPISEIARTAGVSQEVIANLESGVLPKNYISTIKVLESMLGIRILKEHGVSVKFVMPEKKKIPEEIENMKFMHSREIEATKKAEKDIKQHIEKQQVKKEAVKEISKGYFDFSDKKKLDTITLNDLLKLKRQKEKAEKDKRSEYEKEVFFGDDLELDEDFSKN